MEKVRKLNRYQKAILLFMIAMIAVFTVIYYLTISSVGYLYDGVIFVLKQENGTTIYSADYNGSLSSFIVSDNNTVLFESGKVKYGPFSFREDPTAIPKE